MTDEAAPRAHGPFDPYDHGANGRLPACSWPGCLRVGHHWRLDNRRRAPERLRACEEHLRVDLPPLEDRIGDRSKQLILLAADRPYLHEAATAMGVSVADVRDLVRRNHRVMLVAGRVVVTPSDDPDADPMEWPPEDTLVRFERESALCRRCPLPAVSADGLCMDCDNALQDEDLHEDDVSLWDETECARCGCTDNWACEGGCHWVPHLDLDLCSACATPEELAAVELELTEPPTEEAPVADRPTITTAMLIEQIRENPGNTPSELAGRLGLHARQLGPAFAGVVRMGAAEKDSDGRWTIATAPAQPQQGRQKGQSTDEAILDAIRDAGEINHGDLAARMGMSGRGLRDALRRIGDQVTWRAKGPAKLYRLADDDSSTPAPATPRAGDMGPEEVAEGPGALVEQLAAALDYQAVNAEPATWEGLLGLVEVLRAEHDQAVAEATRLRSRLEENEKAGTTVGCFRYPDLEAQPEDTSDRADRLCATLDRLIEHLGYSMRVDATPEDYATAAEEAIRAGTLEADERADRLRAAVERMAGAAGIPEAAKGPDWQLCGDVEAAIVALRDTSRQHDAIRSAHFIARGGVGAAPERQAEALRLIARATDHGWPR